MKKMTGMLRKCLIWMTLTVLLAAGAAGCGAEESYEAGKSAAESSYQAASEAASEAADDVIGQAEEVIGQAEEALTEAEDADEDEQAEAVTDEAVSADSDAASADNDAEAAGSDELYIDPDGTYDSAEDVALYLYLYGELPSNYITKNEAKDLGWSGGSVEQYAEGKCIGGSNYGNYEGILPDGKYHECDIDTLGASGRGAKRIVYSTDGNIYYTDDHYETFRLLYTADGPVEDEIIYK